MQYTKIPATTFENLQMNAGILVDDFTPDTATIGNLIGATTGGINFTDSIYLLIFLQLNYLLLIHS